MATAASAGRGMKSLSFRKILFLLMLLPMVAAAALASWLTRSAFVSYGDMRAAASYVRLGLAGGNLAQALPAEALAPASKQSEARARLDASLEQLWRAYGAIENPDPQISAIVEQIKRRSGSIAGYRKRFDAGRGNLPLAMGVYQPIAAEGFKLVDRSAALPDDAAAARAITGYHAALQVRDGGLIEMIVGGEAMRNPGALAMGESLKLSPDSLAKLLHGVELQEDYLAGFRNYVDPAIVSRYDAFLAGPTGQEIEELRSLAVGNSGYAKPDGSDRRWAETTQSRAELTRQLVEETAAQIGAMTESNLAAARNRVILLASFTIAIVVGALGFCAWAIAALTGLFDELAATLRSLAEDRLDLDVPHTGRPDVVGTIAKATASFKLRLLERRDLEAQARARDEAGAAERHKLVREMADGFESRVSGLVENLSSAAKRMEAATHSMAEAADDAMGKAAIVLSGSVETSESVRDVQGATEGLAEAAEEIGRRADASAQKVERAVQQSRHSDAVVERLSSRIAKVEEVVSLINRIAGQTNLLALNATIEAARAGEAGKGFAVVANEVKSLANQTARATEEISASIAEITAAMREAVASTASSAGAIHELNEIALAIAAAATEQMTSTQTIVSSLHSATNGAREVKENIGVVSDVVSHVSSAAHSNMESAASLVRSASSFKEELQAFLATVRAA